LSGKYNKMMEGQSYTFCLFIIVVIYEM